MAQERKPAPDWERIEADYRAGLLSLREIAAARGVSNVAIHKRAKKEGWERDLGKRIQAKADALVSKREAASKTSADAVASDRIVVEANATLIAEVRLSHRRDIARSRNLAMQMLEELERATTNTDVFEKIADLLRESDDIAERRLEAFNKIMSSAGRIDSMKKLADTLRTLVTLEREAYGLTADPDGGTDDVPTSLDHFYGAD